MAQLNLLPPGFVQGVVEYTDYDPSQSHSRIMIPVHFGDVPRETYAVLDTGAPWCILNPLYASSIGVDYRVHGTVDHKLGIRGVNFNGWLCTDIPIRIEADRGKSLAIAATVFIPELEPGQIWDLPSFLGLSGFLERIRFAIDPGNNLFYFGALDD
jgi:hypothetical protein